VDEEVEEEEEEITTEVEEDTEVTEMAEDTEVTEMAVDSEVIDSEIGRIDLDQKHRATTRSVFSRMLLEKNLVTPTSSTFSTFPMNSTRKN
jgi:hypothetical protein